MATLVLGTVGRAFGGPLGAIIGTAVGSFVDHGLGGGSNGPASNPAVQSAAYGEAIPVISGRMRAAGNLIWASGIRETAGSGDGKRNGASTAAYRYTASFAVALAARPIDGIGRIWADGRLIRGADGVFPVPTIMRLYRGTESQQPDALIAAAEGPAATPAYRGIAYVVFEDLVLEDFGNRIPNLTFEIIADTDASIDAGRVLAILASIDRKAIAEVTGGFPALTGHYAGTPGSLVGAMDALVAISGGSLRSVGSVEFVGASADCATLPEADCHARLPGGNTARDRLNRLDDGGSSDAIEIGYYDSGCDYQPGLQRARRATVATTRHLNVPCAMSAIEARSLANTMLLRSQVNRLQTVVRLPWRYLGLRAGDQVRLGGDPTIWRIKTVRFENFLLALDLVRTPVAPLPVVIAAAAGRSAAYVAEPAGASVIEVLDIPLLQGEVSRPRLLVAMAGRSSGWRGAGLAISHDDGVSYGAAGRLEIGTTMGNTTTLLAAGPADCWDRHSSVEVELVSDGMWLESRPGDSVLAGANLALVGDEIVQFARAEAIAPRRFRLSEMLRGRRGTENRIASHSVGERFVFLDPARLMSVPLPLEAIARDLRLRPAGPDDGNAEPLRLRFAANSLRPLAPVCLRVTRRGGSVRATWQRRSRLGFAWLDFIDAPLAETAEAYAVCVAVDGEPVEAAVTGSRSHDFVVPHAARGCHITFTVRQLSAAIGPGEAASIEISDA